MKLCGNVNGFQSVDRYSSSQAELDLNFDLGIMSNFDGFNNISYQCLEQEEIECEQQDVEEMLATAEKVPKRNAFSLMNRKRALVDEKKRDRLEQKR